MDMNKTISLTYKECKKWINKKLYDKRIKTRYDWIKIKNKLPDFIPKNPKSFYADCGWISWDDFLSVSKKKYLSYDKANKWVHRNLDMKKINTIYKWRLNTWQLPDFIPKEPDKFYKFTGWLDWNDWLGKNKD